MGPACPPGTFYARERVAALFGFVREALQSDWLPFELLASGGQKLSEDENLPFTDCGLVSAERAARLCLRFPPVVWGWARVRGARWEFAGVLQAQGRMWG